MTTKLTINPLPEATLSPYQAQRATAYNLVNNDFLGSFKDLIDVVNPLQQLPVVSTAYRALTGDTISSGARLVGGALFGGPLGFVLSLANEIVASETGGDLGTNLFAAATDKYKETDHLLS